MTIGEIIKERVDIMPPGKQRKVLSLVRSLDKSPRRKQKTTSSTKRINGKEGNYIPKDPALRAIAGMWEDRTDLPKDPVKAVKVLRARMWSRGRNA